MNKDKLGRKDIFRISFLLVFACFFLCVAWIWGNRGEWIPFSIYLINYLVFAMWLSITVASAKLDKRFDRLEKLLSKQHETKKEEKRAEQDTDKTAEV